MTTLNWSKDMVEQAAKRWNEFWDWAEQSGVPLPVLESMVRDRLAAIDAMRFKAFVPVLQLDKELMGHLNVSMERGSLVKR